MAEIKNTFLKGKMNKDLDERLVSKGEYRDAMNVEVSTSEGSDVGTVQNILGNYRVDNEISTSDFKCVGSIADEKNNRIFWFVTSNETDAILEWDENLQRSDLIFVDVNKRNSYAALRFPNTIITGINVIDNFLFWTDGITEPKKIDIEACRKGTSTINVQTKLILNNDFVLIDTDGDNVEDNRFSISESYITVIKKRPTNPPYFKINHSETNTEKSIFEKIFPRFCYRYKYVDGSYSAFGPFTNPVFSAKHVENVNALNYYNLKHGHNRSMANTIESIELMDFVPSDIPLDVVQVDLLYKREDSNVVYSIANIRSGDEEFNVIGSASGGRFDQDTSAQQILRNRGRYLVKSENVYAAIPENQLLRSWDNVPKKAVAQEITGNRLVYGNYTQGYDLGSSSVKIKSYYEARDVKGADQNTEGIQSLKSQREYQLGIVYGDKYGRETPVFTSTEGSVKVPWIDNSNISGQSFLTPLSLSAVVETKHPEWAEYFKFYVKQTSGEYYNLLMDKLYMPSSSTDFENKEDHVWLAFPSSEINKVQEEDYLILKKVSGSVEKPVEDKNRYKIIDIKAEAPDSVAYAYLPVGEVSNTENPDGTTVSANINLADGGVEGALFQDANARIDKEVSSIEIDKSSWIAFGIPTLRGSGNNSDSNSGVDNSSDIKNIYVSWKKTDGNGFETHSKRYRANSIQIDSTLYRLKLDEAISRDDAALAAHDTNNARLHQDLTFSVTRKEKRDGQDFSGKFFVKILADKIIRDNITSLDSNASTTRFVSSRKSMFWWADILATNELEGLNSNIFLGYGTNPDLQPNGLDSIAGATDTVEDWDFLLSTYQKRLFIDNMFMTGANLSSTGYAKEAGKGVTGNIVNYGKAEWNSEAATNEDLPTWNLNASSTWAQADTDGVATSSWKNNMVNGMSGLVEASSNYTQGPFSWKKSIYEQETDETYGQDAGSYFMHLSFLAPGKDLNDGTFGGDSALSNVDVAGDNSIAGLLQGIWGGGAFTTQNNAPLLTDDGIETKFIEFEGNYADTTTQLADAPGPGVGKGYDLEYKEYHERQWDPTFSPSRWTFGSSSQTDDNLERFVKNIAIGKKFRFEDDTSEELYTILDISIKHIYNHTPWRTKFTLTDNQVVIDENSVEYAASAWALAKQTGTQTEIDVAGEALANKIVSFGKASNRRTTYILRLDKNPNDASFNPTQGGSNNVDLDTSTNMQFVDDKAQALSGLVKDVSASFETEPKDSIDLNIFYEAGQAIPTYLTKETVNQFAPPGCRVEIVGVPQAKRGAVTISENVILTRWEVSPVTQEISFVLTHEISGAEDGGYGFNKKDSNGLEIDYSDARVRFYREDGSYTTCRLGANIGTIAEPVAGYSTVYRLRFAVNRTIDPSLQMGLNWYNCITFGDGVESNRIRDDFNAMQISNGARASTTIEEPYEEEQRQHGMIYSGLYNSQTGLNSLNQFIQAEKITKDLNPTFGSIQKLFSRTSDLIAFCEDRVVKVLANKDAVFNADGNPQLVATTNVLGQATPFVGDYGISKNPESFSKESYRAYFTDKQRGAVLRLSMDGLTPISDAGMHDYFRDALPLAGTILGTYDDYKKQYNITFKEFVYNNIIENSYVNEGQAVSTAVFETEIINNPALESGVGYSPVSIESLYEAGGANTPIQNPNFLSNVKLINWPAIGVGEITAYVNEITENVYGDITYNVNANGNVTQTNLNADGTPETIVTQEAVELQPAVLPTFGTGNYMHRAQAGQYATTSSLGYTDGFGTLDNVNYQGVGASIVTTQDSPYIVAGSSGSGGYTGWKIPTTGLTFPGTPNDGSWNTGQVPSAILAAHPEAHDLSVFNGEEVWVLVHYRVEFNQGLYNNTSNTTPPQVNFNLKLIDAATGDASGFRSINLTDSVGLPAIWSPTITTTNNPWLSSNGGYATVQDYSYYTAWEIENEGSSNEGATYVNPNYNNYNASMTSTDGGAVVSSDASYSWHLPKVKMIYGNLLNNAYISGNNFNTQPNTTYIWNTYEQRMLVKFKLFSPTGTPVLNTDKIIDQLNVVISATVEQQPIQYDSSNDFYSDLYSAKTRAILTDAAIYKGWEMKTKGSERVSAVTETTEAVPAEYGYFEGVYVNPGDTTSYMGVSAPVVGTNVVQAEVAAFPASAIPAWAEVKYTLPENWSTMSASSVTLNSIAVSTYGPENPGQWNTANGITYYSGSSNGVTSYSNTGSLISSVDGINLPGVNEGAKEQLIEVDDEILIDTNGANSGYFSQVFDTPLIEGHYYAVDVEYDDDAVFPFTFANGYYRIQDVGTFRIQGCIPLDVATAAHQDTHLSNSAFYPGGYYGQIVTNNNSGDIIFMERDFVGYGDVQGPVLRAVFRATSNATSANPLTKIRIQGWNMPATSFKSFNIVDVTPTGSGGTFSEHWSTNVTGTLYNALSEPTAYYDNGGWVWNFPSTSFTISDALDNFIKYTFDNNELAEQTDQGYSFQFEVDSILSSGLTEGELSIKVAQTADDNGDYKVLRVENINAAGTYIVKFNYDGTAPYFDLQPDASSATLALQSAGTGGSARIVARPHSIGFVGKLTLVSIIDETQIISGGTSSSWVFSEFDYENNETNVFTEASGTAFFEEGQIVFNNAFAGTQISQNINQVIAEGETYNVSFDFIPDGCGFEVYYFSNQGVGFKVSADQQTIASGVFSENLNIEQLFDGFNPTEDLTNSLVIRLLDPLNSLSIDNITMTRVVENSFNNSTVSYSEDVKGWVSFKSFIPEGGLSVSKKYFTFNRGKLYEHYYEIPAGVNYNEFYGVKYPSHITTLLNDSPGIVKTFRTLTYEGSQGYIIGQTGQGDAEVWNRGTVQGWQVPALHPLTQEPGFKTNMDQGSIKEFIEKEEKWFNYIRGSQESASKVDMSLLSFQGAGTLTTDALLIEEEQPVEDS